MKRKPTEASAYTVAKFSQLVGFDRHSLASRIQDMGIEASGQSSAQGAELYSLRNLVRAVLGGDIAAEQLRVARETADKLALQNSRTRGELVEIASVKKLGEKVMIAIRQRILNMPLTDDEKDKCLTELLNLKDLDWSREG
jgi:phage terminase Nu1 subunit (DNA packaging protein)